MPSKIYSFGFRHRGGMSPEPDNKCLVIDVRKWLTKNPYHDKKLRKLRGTDPAVQEDIRKHTNFDAVVEELAEAIYAHPGPVYFGCTGGHHRSVYIAEIIGQQLNVPVEHLDINKP